MTDKKPILCVDFDGVIHSYETGWHGAHIVSDGPVPGAIPWLYAACLKFDVQIYSSRSSQPGGIDAMKEAIGRWETDWRRGQEAVPRTSLLLNIKFPVDKPPAFLTLDDRCIQFKGVFPMVEDLVSFKPWNKQ